MNDSMRLFHEGWDAHDALFFGSETVEPLTREHCPYADKERRLAWKWGWDAAHEKMLENQRDAANEAWDRSDLWAEQEPFE